MITPSPTANAQDVTHNPWIKWEGGECPVAPDTIVDVCLSSGVTMDGYSASSWSEGAQDWWQRYGRADGDPVITAYRIVSGPNAQNADDAALLDWLEEAAKASPTGISFDWVPSVDGEPSGFRFMRRHFVGEQAKTLRESITFARSQVQS